MLFRSLRSDDGRRVRRPSVFTAAGVASLFGLTIGQFEAEARERLPPDAYVPATHVDAEQLAFFAGCDVAEVLDAVDSGELSRAVQRTGLLDLSSPAVVEFVARRPFRHLPGGELDAPDGYLSAARLDDDNVDLKHPVTVIFMARCLGRVPTAEELS